VLARYSDAVKRGDDQAVWALLSARAQRDLGPQGVKRLLKEQRQEIGSFARSVTDPRAAIAIQAGARFVDGELASFSVERGELFLQAASALPARATTPEQALSDLRAVLARRSYPGLTRVLTTDSAQSLEAKMQSLVNALQDPASLEIKMQGDRAVVDLPNGHRVELSKENGLWKIHDFE
jgi:hypothetical protein